MSRCENICSARVTFAGRKPPAEPIAAAKASNGEGAIDPAYRIAAE